MEALELENISMDEPRAKHLGIKTYTYAEYARWDTDDRYELIDGIPYMMASPSSVHQHVVGEVLVQLANALRGKPCRPFVSPLDVCLFGKGDDDKTVVQPDVLVVCDRSKITTKYINGAPDFVVEVVSPSSTRKDHLLKLNKYMMAGVREYWILDPEDKLVYTYIRRESSHEFAMHEDPGDLPVSVLEGCTLDMRSVFDMVLPEEPEEQDPATRPPEVAL